MELLETIAPLFGGIGGIGFLVAILILHKSGVLKYLLNGKNGNGKNMEVETLKTQFATMKENHTHEMRTIAEALKDIARDSQESVIILRDIKNK